MGVAIIIWLFCAFISMSVARAKRRSGFMWFLAGLLFGPFGFAVALLPRLDSHGDVAKPKPVTGSGVGKIKVCPMCAETIKWEARKCRFCGEVFDDRTEQVDEDFGQSIESGAPDSTPPVPTEEPSSLPFFGFLTGVLLAVLIVVLFIYVLSGQNRAKQGQRSPEVVSRAAKPPQTNDSHPNSSQVQQSKEDTDSHKREQETLGIGNNSEAEDFAKSMTEGARAAWPKGHIVWKLELKPEKISAGGIIKYRKSVSYCKATISIDRSEWFDISETGQRNFITTLMNVLHKPPLMPLSDTIDYYPNSAGEVNIMVDGNVVATGKYSKTQNNIVLKPNTYKPDEINKYSANITVTLENTTGIKLSGKTNIPDSTSILFTLIKGDYRVQSKVTVKNGSFETETFGYGGKPFPLGKYSIKLNTTNPLLEAKGDIVLPNTKSLTVVFAPTKL